MKNIIKYFLIYFFFMSLLSLNECLQAQWTRVNGPFNDKVVGSISLEGKNIYVSSTIGLFFSSDYGLNWKKISTGLPEPEGALIAISGTNLFAASWENGIFYSNNNGESWTKVGPKAVSSLLFHGTNLFAAVYGSGIYLTSDNGTNWTVRNSGLTDFHITSLITHLDEKGESNIIVGTAYSFESGRYGTYYGGGVFTSSNMGITWIKRYPLISTKFDVNHLAANVTKLFASTASGLFISSDNGNSWKQDSGLAGSPGQILVLNNHVFVVTTEGFFQSSNNGLTWRAVNISGLTNFHFNSLVSDEKNVFVSTYNGLWKCSISELTLIKEETIIPPEQFELSQNYPNPFNPNTKIKYSIPEQSIVQIKVYDILGREIMILLNELKTPGNYELEFNGSKLSSGTYFYQLKAKDFIDTKKFVLTK